MKELSIEEKAERYDKSFERASNIHKDAVEMENSMITKTCEVIFPELVESEDERIRKEILDYIHAATGCKRWVAWLEKEGEQREQLINKACDVLVNCIEDFMLRRMEIWDEECKKQTLENIRKKLEE